MSVTTSVYLNAASAYSALGVDAESMRAHLFADADPQTLRWTDQYSPGRVLPLGCLPEGVELPVLDFAPAHQRSRNNALAWAAMQDIRGAVDAAIARHGPERVALIVGTSTGGLDEGTLAAAAHRQTGQFPEGFNYSAQELGDVAAGGAPLPVVAHRRHRAAQHVGAQ